MARKKRSRKRIPLGYGYGAGVYGKKKKSKRRQPRGKRKKLRRTASPLSSGVVFKKPIKVGRWYSWQAVEAMMYK